MGNNTHLEIIDSVGIEVEFSNFDRNDRSVKSIMDKNLPGYKRAHDASCETPAISFANTGLVIDFENDEDFKTLQSICQPTVIGGEIISPIRNSCGPQWVEEIHKLCEMLENLGETEESNRDSLHIHVNVSKDAPLFVLQNLLRLTASLEAILFRLGGMGRLNRGEENHYCYMRPFLGNGPPIISQQYGGKGILVPVFVFDDLMSAETKEDFFDRYCNSRNHAYRNVRYVAQRYMCVNFYPILTQGSFEFRTANKTLRPEYILAWTNFCKALIEKAYSSRDEKSFETVKRPLHDNREIPNEEFEKALSYIPALDDDTIQVLFEIWSTSPTPFFDNLMRFTHLRDYPTYSGETKYYCPERIKNPEDVQEAEFVDIHQLNREERHWDVPRDIEQFGRPQAVEVRAERNWLVQFNAEGQVIDGRHIPTDLIGDWWIELDRPPEGTIAIRRHPQNPESLQIALADYTQDEEINLSGEIRDNGTFVNLGYMFNQWINDEVHPDNMFINEEE